MDDLIVEFLTETNEFLATIDEQLVNLEQNPNDTALLGSIFRLMHTIKGTCGFLGLPRLEKVAHHAENVMGRFRDGTLEVTPDYVTLIFESIDRIKEILSGIEETGTEQGGDDTSLIARLDAVFESDGNAPDVVDTTSAGQAAGNDPFQDLWDSTPGPEDMATPSNDAPHDTLTPQSNSPTPDTPAPALATDQTPKESSVANQTLRVNVDVLENLMTLVSELVLTRNQLLQILRGAKDNDFTAPLQRLNHVVSDLQEGVMKTRMQPIGAAWNKLPRIIRDLSHELGKKIELVMTGQDTELDRQVLELIKDPLTHMVRNSGDHGIETPAERIAAGKPEMGRIHLKAYHEGGHIIIQIQDDGKGLNTARIREKILEKNIVSEAEIATMTDNQIQQYIFAPGFSTATAVTAVSGRGVGMDVVRTNIERIGGTISLQSQEGLGSTFTIKIPLTLAIVSALIVESGGERYAIPQLAVQELVLASSNGENRIENINGTPVFRLRDKLLPLVYLQKLLELPTQENQSKSDLQYIVVTNVGGYIFGIIVDRVFDTEEIVIKPVARILQHIDLFSGNTILGDGSVIMILDPAGIAKATGDNNLASSQSDAQDASLHSTEDRTALLLFLADGNAPRAVPLSLISRLEDIEVERIETSNGRMLIQYRDSLMPLIPFSPDMELATEGTQPVLVFSDRDRNMGLMVREIIDIVEEDISVQIHSEDPGYLGSAVIRGKATDIIDVGYHLTSTREDWFKNHDDVDFISTNQVAEKRHILVVDDSPFFRNMLSPLLTVSGYQVTTADNPIEALNMRENGQMFDLIISDIEMPEMDGYAFASAIRGGDDKTWASTPLLALTSHATKNDIARGHSVGFDDYVAKFDRDNLLRAISKTLQSAPKDNATSQSAPAL